MYVLIKREKCTLCVFKLFSDRLLVISYVNIYLIFESFI